MKNKIAFIAAQWHESIVHAAQDSFYKEMQAKGFDTKNIDLFKVPGSLEFPYTAKLLAVSGKYDLIVCAGFIINGGIYRHEFVAASVIDGIVKVSVETLVPVLSVVLTAITFDEKNPADHKWFADHMRDHKGKEAAEAAITMLNLIKSQE